MEVMQSKEQVFTREKAYWMYQKMLEIRKFEDKVHELFAQGILPGFVHLYAGEEAVAVGVCAHLNDRDSITSTHRGHGHCIAKGCDLNGMMAEIYGKATGLCKGKGGSMPSLVSPVHVPAFRQIAFSIAEIYTLHSSN